MQLCACLLNAPGRSRTCNLRFRRPTLYPIELRAHANVLPGSIDEFNIILNYCRKARIGPIALAGRNQYQNNFEIFDASDTITADEASVFVTFSAAAWRRGIIAARNPIRFPVTGQNRLMPLLGFVEIIIPPGQWSLGRNSQRPMNVPANMGLTWGGCRGNLCYPNRRRPGIVSAD